jgi:hypothetical protein
LNSRRQVNSRVVEVEDDALRVAAQVLVVAAGGGEQAGEAEHERGAHATHHGPLGSWGDARRESDRGAARRRDRASARRRPPRRPARPRRSRRRGLAAGELRRLGLEAAGGSIVRGARRAGAGEQRRGDDASGGRERAAWRTSRRTRTTRRRRGSEESAESVAADGRGGHRRARKRGDERPPARLARDELRIEPVVDRRTSRVRSRGPAAAATRGARKSRSSRAIEGTRAQE